MNEAAERLRSWVREVAVDGEEMSDWLDEALAAECRATVEEAAEALDLLGGMWSWNPDGVPDSLAHLWWGRAGLALERLVGRPARNPAILDAELLGSESPTAEAAR